PGSRAALGRSDEHDHRPVPRRPRLRAAVAAGPSDGDAHRHHRVVRALPDSVPPLRGRPGEGRLMQPRLRVEHLWQGYKYKTKHGARRRGEMHWVLRDVSFTAHGGELLAVIGSNGSGKTSLL